MPPLSTIHRTRSGCLKLVLCAALALTGSSLTPLAKHTVVFSTATNLVVTNSEDAYRAAIKLHELEQAPDFVARYQSETNFNPYDWKQPKPPLITPEGLKTRVELLDSLRVYAQSLVEVANGGDTVALNAAAKSLGGSLNGLTTAINTDMAGGKGSTSTGLTMSDKVAPGVATGIKALADYLVNKKVQKSLPLILEKMDEPVRNIATLLESDVTILRRQTKDDYEQIVSHRDNFIRKNLTSLSSIEREHAIEQLPVLIAEQQRADMLLEALSKAIRDLALTHHALAAAAQHNNPVSLADRIHDLENSEAELAKFYQSLQSKEQK